MSEKVTELWIDPEILINSQNLLVTFVSKKAEEKFIHVISIDAYRELEKKLAAYKNQSPEDFLTPYENELLGDKQLLEKENTRFRQALEKMRAVTTEQHVYDLILETLETGG